MNTYASMTITYAVATLFSALAFFVTSKGGNILKEFSHTNWATIVLGIVITGLKQAGKSAHWQQFQMRLWQSF